MGNCHLKQEFDAENITGKFGDKVFYKFSKVLSVEILQEYHLILCSND